MYNVAMQLEKITPGNNPPCDINVIIEIPAGSNIKYEIDKATSSLVVDRFVATPMYYPLNYGYIPNTLSGDGDPTDVLVVTPDNQPLLPASVIRCRPVGVLLMEDEGGSDEKIVAVPHTKVTPVFDAVKEPEHLPQLLRQQIVHFFEHYKELEPGKWVKMKDWQGSVAAQDFITQSIQKATSTV